MSPRACAIARTLAAAMLAIETLDPAEQDLLIASLVSDLRARRPVAVAPLGVLPPPTETIKDPRV